MPPFLYIGYAPMNLPTLSALPITNPLISTLHIAIGLPSNQDVFLCSDPDFTPSDWDALLYGLDDGMHTLSLEEYSSVAGSLSIERARSELVASGRVILGQGTYSQCKALCKAWRTDKKLRRTLIISPKPTGRAQITYLDRD